MPRSERWEQLPPHSRVDELGSSSTMSGRWQSSSSLVRLLAGRWTLSVLAELDGGGRRYQDIYNGIERARNGAQVGFAVNRGSAQLLGAGAAPA